MEAINKNKEEIEKIDEEIVDCQKPIQECIFCQIADGKKQERIKTSILWCEDEIERWTPYLNFMDISIKDEPKTFKIKMKLIQDGYNYLEQLQTHLTWLKEQEKKE